jgi:hypothetical protein
MVQEISKGEEPRGWLAAVWNVFGGNIVAWQKNDALPAVSRSEQSSREKFSGMT